MMQALADFAHWQDWIGRTEVRTEIIDPSVLRRYAAAIGESLDVETTLPSLAHWAFFHQVASPDGLGPDGHVKRGGFLPPVDLPRRMFAASDIRFHSPLTLGEAATRTARVVGIAPKTGRSGMLVLLEVEHRIEQAGTLRIVERQAIVYRETGDAMPPVPELPFAPPPGAVAWQPGPIDLFRFSAVTFNSHRIHYDLPYATGAEGYPGLVVQGPFTAARLFDLARMHGPQFTRFRFRAQAPIFAGQPILLAPRTDEGSIQAIRCDGTIAMIASFEN